MHVFARIVSLVCCSSLFGCFFLNNEDEDGGECRYSRDHVRIVLKVRASARPGEVGRVYTTAAEVYEFRDWYFEIDGDVVLITGLQLPDPNLCSEFQTARDFDFTGEQNTFFCTTPGDESRLFLRYVYRGGHEGAPEDGELVGHLVSHDGQDIFEVTVMQFYGLSCVSPPAPDESPRELFL